MFHGEAMNSSPVPEDGWPYAVGLLTDDDRPQDSVTILVALLSLSLNSHASRTAMLERPWAQPRYSNGSYFGDIPCLSESYSDPKFMTEPSALSCQTPRRN